MHRKVATAFESVEEALQYHSNRPSTSKKIPVIWAILEEDPKTTNKDIVRLLNEKGLFADGTLIGEIRRSVRKAKGLPARKSRKVRGATAPSNRTTEVALDLEGIPPSVLQDIELPVAFLIKAMKKHGLDTVKVQASGGVSYTYRSGKVSGLVK